MSLPVQVTPSFLRALPLPEIASDKDSRGVVLVVAGGTTTPGAVILAAESALRAGAGKLQVMTSEATSGVVGQSLPEARVLGLAAVKSGDPDASMAGEILDNASQAAAVLLGPGWVDPDNASALGAGVVPALQVPFVLDALATAYVTDDPEALRVHEGRAVLTMNPAELGRTLHLPEDDVLRRPGQAAVELARRSACVVLCGSDDKFVATPDGKVHVVTVGNPGLGVSGSGDVQAGLVAGLLARGCDTLTAAVWGAYLHGAAGDRLAGEQGPVGFLARELPSTVPALLAELTRTD